jgi:hypothetical protein
VTKINLKDYAIINEIENIFLPVLGLLAFELGFLNFIHFWIKEPENIA